MANQLLNTQMITRSQLDVLSNNLEVIPRMTRYLDEEFGKSGRKIGDTIYVRKPWRPIGRSGAAYQPEGLVDTQVPITINQQTGVDFQFSTQEDFLSIDDWNTRYGDPSAINIANKLDLAMLLMMSQNTAHFVGTPGTTPGDGGSNAFRIYANAGRKIDDAGFPLKGQERNLIIVPAMRVGWIDYNKSNFNDQEALGKQFKTGQVASALGYKWAIDQNVNTQVLGAFGGTPAVAGANQTGSTINLSGLSNSIAGWANIGDVISFAGVYEVNPQSRVSNGSLMQFVIQATVNSDGAGLASVVVSPALVPSGNFQNVTNSPANGALVSVYDLAAGGQSAIASLSSPQAMLFLKEAFAFVSFAGRVPGGVDKGTTEMDEDTGVALRYVRDFSQPVDMWTNRYDVYWGGGPLYPEGACRIAG